MNMQTQGGTQTERTTPQQQQRLRELNQQIAQRAYEKWCKRGYQHGQDQQDWLEAEREVRSGGDK